MSNTYTKPLSLYITECIINGIFSIALYKVLLFRTVSGLSYTISEIVFFTSFILLFTAGIFITAKNQRNSANTYFNSIFPLGLYNSIAYINELKIIIIFLIVFSLITSIISIISILKEKSKNSIKTRNRIVPSIIVSRNIFALASAIIIIPMIFNAVFFHALFNPNQFSVDPRYEEWRISEKYLDLKAFADEETWDNLTQVERLNALQTMANIKAADLGIPHELKVSAGTAKENVVAHYCEQYYSITFNIDLIDKLSAREALYTLLHECYHSYQYCIVDLLKDADEKYKNIKEVQKAQKYQNEFANYENGYTDYDSYADQWCEIYADDYADICTDQHIKEINYYLKKNDN